MSALGVQAEDPTALDLSLEDELVSWVSKSLDRAFSPEPSESIFVEETTITLDSPPYRIFDFATLELNFFTTETGFLLGLGAAKKVDPASDASSRAEIDTILKGADQRKITKLWLFGGWSFPAPKKTNTPKQSVWKGFPASRWTLPALTIVSQNGASRLVLAVDVEHGTRAEGKRYCISMARDLCAATSLENGLPSLPKSGLIEDTPSLNSWETAVDDALDRIARGTFEKVVPARSRLIHFYSDIPVSTVVRNLVESKDGTTVFALKYRDAVFLGATPERLLTVKNGTFEVDCLAASAPRSPEKTEDDLLGMKLQSDPKSRLEHQLLVDQVARTLSDIAMEIHISGEPQLKKFPNVQHLQVIISGKLRPGESVLQAAKKLWPTAATCGEPRKSAQEWLLEFEEIDRGWYSGVVGYVDAKEDEAKLYVALRSGLIRGKLAALFAGSGIVPGSVAEKEYEEAEWKLKTMMNALTNTK
jgi:isochorismate synthase